MTSSTWYICKSIWCADCLATSCIAPIWVACPHSARGRLVCQVLGGRHGLNVPRRSFAGVAMSFRALARLTSEPIKWPDYADREMARMCRSVTVGTLGVFLEPPNGFADVARVGISQYLDGEVDVFVAY